MVPPKHPRSRGRAAAAVIATSAAMLLAGHLRALALDPTLDLSQYGHTAWKVRGGSFKDSIAAIAQTPDGYLWLGTQFGLLRFDGVRHVLWEPPAGQQLPSTNIRSLFAASDGRLWIGTQLGLASLKGGMLSIHGEIPRLVGGIIEDRNGTVWAAARHPPPGKLCAFRGNTVQCFGEKGEFGGRASSLYEDRGGRLWVGAETGLWRWMPGSPKHYPLNDFESSEGLVQTDDGELLIAGRTGLRRFVNERIVDFPLPGEIAGFQPSRLLRDRGGAVWIGTFDRGLVHVHRGRVDQFSQADGLSGNYVRDIFEDREGNIWVATDNGLDRFRETAVTTISVKQGLSQGTPWSVLVSTDGSVWAGTLGGLNRLEDGQITVYRNRSRSAGQRAEAGPGEPMWLAGESPGGTQSSRHVPAVKEVADRGLPDDLIQSLFEDDRGRVWVSTRRGIAHFEDGRFTPVPGVPGGVHAIAGDAAGNIWISEDQGLLRVVGDKVAERISWATLGRNVPALPMLADPTGGGLWLGFRDGTGLASFKDGRIVATYGTAEGLGRGMVGDLSRDSDGTIWAATEGGLSRIQNGRIRTLTAKHGLPCDGVHWAIEDNDKAVWLYTACGLARIARSDLDAWTAAAVTDTNTATIVRAEMYDSSDGVRIHTAPGGYAPQVGKSPDGRIWFLPWDGVSVIDPRRLRPNPLPPPVHIERITADGIVYPPSAGLRLPPLARDVAIEYTALNLTAPEKTRFRFKLEGQDPQWREALDDRRVQYSNLGPGPYRFRVLASNSSGVWNESGATLEFAIAPAYYQTTWFRVLSASAVLLVLGGAYRLRVRKLRQEEWKLREIVDSIPAIAGIARPDGSTAYLNRRWVEFTGLSAGSEAGSGWHVAVHPDDEDDYVAKWRASLARGESFAVEARLRSAAGRYRWFLVRAVPVRDKRGAIRNWYGVMTDIEDQKEAERELERLSGRLIHAQEEERSRIARELHDHISQALGLLAVRIDQLQADPSTSSRIGTVLGRLRHETGEVVTDVHRLAHQLHSSTLDHLGLVPATQGLVAEFSKRLGIAVSFADKLVPPLPSEVALCLFRVIQEGLNNIAKHSQARSAQVRVIGTADGVHLTIEDDGVGFNVTDVETHRGLGFVSMRERLRVLRGTVRVESAPGEGTRIEVDVPALSLVISESSA